MKEFPTTAALLAAMATLLVFPAAAQDAAPAAADEAAELPVLAASDTAGLKQKDGQKVTVVGKCDRTGKSGGGTNFINFEGSEFVLVTFKSDLEPFKDGEPADIYRGKHLSVTGVIGIFKDAPQIVLTDPAQVKVSDEPFKAPTAEEKAAEAAAEAEAEKAKAAAEADAEKARAAAEAAKSGQPVSADGKPKPPVDPRRYFKKPAPKAE